MPVTLADVKHALKQRDQKTAAKHLQEVLRTKPSAEAWYIAAKMTSDKDKAVKHLKRALVMDPNHGPTLSYMAELGVKPNQSGGNPIAYITNEVQDELRATAGRLPVLRDMDERMGVLVLGSVLGILFLAFFVMLVSVLSGFGGNQLPPPPPTQPRVLLQTGNALDAHFTNSGLPIASINQEANPADSSATTRITINLSDGQPVADGATPETAYTAYIYFYNTIRGLINDEDLLATYDATHTRVFDSNALLLTPNDLPANIADQLRTAFESAPRSQA